jgi:hypothetical protein
VELEAPAASEVRAVVRAGLEAPAESEAQVASEEATALATAVWAAGIRWVIAVASEAGQEVIAAGPHAPAAAVVFPAWEGVEAAEALEVVAVEAVAEAVAGGGNDHESHNYEIIAL